MSLVLTRVEMLTASLSHPSKMENDRSHLTVREGEMKTFIFAAPMTVVLANILTIADVHPGKAQRENTFVIAATSGYGVEDCR